MNDILVPDWIKKLKAKEIAAQERQHEELLKAANTATKIAAEGPKFWRDLLKELALNAESLSEIGMCGKVSPSGNESCRVQVSIVGLMPAQTYTDLFFSEENPTIRCHTQEGQSFNLVFALGC